MAKKNHFRSRRERKKISRKNMILISLTLLLVCAAAIPALAWLTAQSQVGNVFAPGETSVDIEEEFDGTTKKNVYVKNSGNVPVYVRAAVSVYWKDSDGNILGDIPGTEDYTVEWNLYDGWVQGIDGLYYFTDPVTAQTTNLIDSASQTKQYDDGRVFYIDISAQSIQAEPSDAVLEAWASAVVGVDEDTGALQMRTGTTGTGGIDQGGRNAG